MFASLSTVIQFQCAIFWKMPLFLMVNSSLIQLMNILLQTMTTSQQLISHTFTGECCSAEIIKTQNIPYSHLIFNSKKDPKTVIQHCKSVYDSVFFIQNLTKPIKEKILQRVISKQVMLKPLSQNQKNLKTLFIDLDETLIYNNTKDPKGMELKINVDNSEILFSLRPYALEFLQNMSKIFELVLFTTGIFSYAEAFFNYFNSLTNNSFSEFLCRDTCVHIYKTIFFKDLRVIGNRSLKNMILLDNSVYCMGSLLNNGVPIISFTGNSDDLELMHIQPYLLKLNESEDIREINSSSLDLAGILKVTAQALL